MNWFAVLILWMLQASAPKTLPDTPAGPGVYYLQDTIRWIGLSHASIANMKIKGLDMFVRSGGYTNLKVKIVCRGSRALMRIPDPRPVFFVRDSGASKDAMLIQLDRRGSNRVYQTIASSATVDNKGGFKKEDIRKMMITPYPDKSFTLAPEEDLKPGEYLIVLGNGTASFDFGID